MKLPTRAIHVPGIRHEGHIAPSIHLSTTFEHGPANEKLADYEYVRYGNANINELEARLASLEGGVDAIAYASGMATITALFGSLPAGSEILIHRDGYFDTRILAKDVLEDRGISHRVLDLADREQLEQALSPATALIWFETPSNPRLDVLDIEAIAELAHANGAKVGIDSTFASPAAQQPLSHGADYVMHSMTKYMGGHSDVLGGALVFRDDTELAAKLRTQRSLTGAVLSPFNAWLIGRGLMTLDCRVEKHSENALALARMLDSHPAVERCNYPFLESSPGYETARKQMRLGGGVLSIELAGGKDAALRVASRFRLFVNATSLGGVESLVEHRESIEGEHSNAPDNLLRLSVGLEHKDDLLADLTAALD